jgi:hypothetical protein
LIPGTPYVSQGQYGFSTASEIKLADPEGVYPAPGNATVRLVDGHGGLMLRHVNSSGRVDERNFSGSTVNSNHHPALMVDVPLDSQRNTASQNPSPVSSHGGEVKVKEPQLSVFLTVMSLIFVTIVRIPLLEILMKELTSMLIS